jgi:hypothetical protein
MGQRHMRESVLFIGTEFSILYTSVYPPAGAAYGTKTHSIQTTHSVERTLSINKIAHVLHCPHSHEQLCNRPCSNKHTRPPAHSFVIGPAVINTHTQTELSLRDLLAWNSRTHRANSLARPTRLTLKHRPRRAPTAREFFMAKNPRAGGEPGR